MEIKKVLLSEVKPYAKNSRKHDQKQIDMIAQSIKDFGFNQPIVVDEKSEIVVGHGRFLAATKLKLKEIPCLVVTNLSETQKRAYRILDNKLQDDSQWEFENFLAELEELQVENFDLVAWGLENFINNDGELVNEEVDMENIHDEMVLKVIFTQDEYQHVIKKLRSVDVNLKRALLTLTEYNV